MAVTQLNSADSAFDAALNALLASRAESTGYLRESVSQLIAQVRAEGDAALCALTSQYDRWQCTPQTLRITTAMRDSLARQCEPEVYAALRHAALRIANYHERQLPQAQRYTDAQGVELGYRWVSLESVGIYVPGGLATYPSTVLMNAIPAQVAGVPRRVMVVPTPEQKMSPAVMAAAQIAGIDEIYAIGGAQAITALAYGTTTIPTVCKIVGPGNAYVAEAKRQVFGDVGIDMIAGPSEVLVVADASAPPEWVAMDLLSQAEHDAQAQAIVLCSTPAVADAINAAVNLALQTLPRGEIARKSWERFGAVIVVQSLADTVRIIDRIAPEHLQLMTEDAEAIAAHVRHAGAIFYGNHTPEAMGDYIAGPSHVLPTSGAARFHSVLSVTDFMRRMSLIRCTPESIAALGPMVVRLAESEGLSAHAASVALRLK